MEEIKNKAAAAPSEDGAVAKAANTAPENKQDRRHKVRTPEEKKSMLARLRRIEGQVRGLERMVEEDAYCPDILVQVSAATSALNSFSKVLLGCHIRSCVAEDIRDGKDETIDELCQVLQKLMK